jgi:intracellular sulfur oxidation DsrE/DsrF family protein
MNIKILLFAGTAALAPLAGHAEGETHHLAIHVDQNDAAVMNMALNNAKNVSERYAAHRDTAVIELVAHGPGLNMLVAGEGHVADRIASMSFELDDIDFSACGNTLAGMERHSGKPIPLLSEATIVPSGVVRWIELQESGYAYVRP